MPEKFAKYIDNVIQIPSLDSIGWGELESPPEGYIYLYCQEIEGVKHICIKRENGDRLILDYGHDESESSEKSSSSISAASESEITEGADVEKYAKPVLLKLKFDEKADKISSASFQDLGSEKTLGLNKSDDTLQKVVDKLNSYQNVENDHSSQSETQTAGIFLDKPIFKKSFSNLPISSNILSPTSVLSNVDTVLDCVGKIAAANSSESYLLNTIFSSYYITPQLVSNNLKILTNWSIVGQLSFTGYIKYTKI